MQNPQIDPATIKAIESVLAKGESVRIIPVRYGVVVKSVREKTVYEPKKTVSP